MISDGKLRRPPSPRVAVLVRLAAFVMATSTLVLVLVAAVGAAVGRGSAAHSGAMAVAAFALTFMAIAAARRVDPLRRRDGPRRQATR